MHVRSAKLSCRKRRGAITLEAAMIFPLLLMIFFASFEFAWMFYVRHTLSNAAREGARAAIVPDATNADVDAAVTAAMRRGGLPNANYSYRITSGSNNVTSPAFVAPGKPVTLHVTTPWSQFAVFNTPIASFWTTDIRGSATMRREG